MGKRRAADAATIGLLALFGALASFGAGCESDAERSACESLCRLAPQCGATLETDSGETSSGEECVAACESNRLLDVRMDVAVCSSCYARAGSCADLNACSHSACPQHVECFYTEFDQATGQTQTFHHEWDCLLGQLPVTYGDAACAAAARGDMRAVGCVSRSEWNGACLPADETTVCPDGGSNCWTDPAFRCDCGAACPTDRCVVEPSDSPLGVEWVRCLDSPSAPR